MASAKICRNGNESTFQKTYMHHAGASDNKKASSQANIQAQHKAQRRNIVSPSHTPRAQQSSATKHSYTPRRQQPATQNTHPTTHPHKPINQIYKP
jgi:predicted lipid-binding transport protein (Tim44 family)